MNKASALAILEAGNIPVALRMRAHRAQALVQTLALIVGQNVPLVSGLRAAARYEHGKLRRILERIAHRLEIGDALSTAVRSSFTSCPGQVTGMIQAGEEGGTLPSVLRSLAVDLQRGRATVARFTPALAYFVTLMLTVPVIALSIAIFLLPKFRDIMLDFGVTSHPMLDRLACVADLIANHSALFVTVLAFILLLLIQLIVGRLFLPRVPDRFQWIPALIDTIVWHVPVLRRISETRALARQLPVMQAAIRAGHDIAPAARQAACVDANFHARRRLLRWAEQIERGGEPMAQARALGFPQALRSGLTSARGPNGLAAALDYLCAYYRSLLGHWEHVFVSFAIPCVVVLWATCIGFVAVSIFAPVYSIVDALIAEVW